jgi:hypothetical protein
MRVMDGLYPASVSQLAAQPDQLLFDPDDLTRYAEGTLATFLLHLDEQQEPLTHGRCAAPPWSKAGRGRVNRRWLFTGCALSWPTIWRDGAGPLGPLYHLHQRPDQQQPIAAAATAAG